MLFQVFHVGDPFDDQKPVSPVDVMHQVANIGRRKVSGVFPVYELLGQVKERLERFGERIMLEYYRVFEEDEKESFLSDEFLFQTRQIHQITCNAILMALDPGFQVLEIGSGPGC